jgi:hypothetical protein
MFLTLALIVNPILKDQQCPVIGSIVITKKKKTVRIEITKKNSFIDGGISTVAFG